VHATTTYIHALKGRLRIKIWEVKGCPTKALELEESLQKCHGINLTRANPITGNVLIHYDTDLIGQSQIIQALQELGYLQASSDDQRPPKPARESTEQLATAPVSIHISEPTRRS
jgi:copper chaperone CopZ